VRGHKVFDGADSEVGTIVPNFTARDSSLDTNSRYLRSGAVAAWSATPTEIWGSLGHYQLCCVAAQGEPSDSVRYRVTAVAWHAQENVVNERGHKLLFVDFQFFFFFFQ